VSVYAVVSGSSSSREAIGPPPLGAECSPALNTPVMQSFGWADPPRMGWTVLRSKVALPLDAHVPLQDAP